MAVNKHQLFLEIPNVKNTGVLLVNDSSIYSASLPVSCSYVEITPPGFTAPTVILADRGFHLVLNSCSLGITPATACGEDCPVLPDGIYHYKYSVSPNTKVFVEYDHLRVTQLTDCWNRLLANIDLADCEPDKDKKDRVNDLYLIKGYIDAAKTEVEDRHDNKKGMQLLLYAKKRLDKLVSGCPRC